MILIVKHIDYIIFYESTWGSVTTSKIVITGHKGTVLHTYINKPPYPVVLAGGLWKVGNAFR